MSVTISDFQTEEAWENSESLKNLLATQLLRGRLALILGAGVSVGFELPNWNVLTSRIAAAGNLTPPAGLSNEEIADIVLLEHCCNDEKGFARLVRDALYAGYDTSLATLTRNELLMAIGATAMASSRGSASRVVTFNFDDVLERYLGYLGFDVESISEMPMWASRVDIRVFHPHGLLPSQKDVDPDKAIVLAKLHYDRMFGGRENTAWHREIMEILKSHICVFIGLSGADDNLTRLLSASQREHVSRGEGFRYWGVRFARPDDSRIIGWRGRGVFQCIVGDYSEIPSWLFTICQRAAAIHQTRRTT